MKHRIKGGISLKVPAHVESAAKINNSSSNVTPIRETPNKAMMRELASFGNLNTQANDT